jgi:hypothetical protein
MEKAGLKKKPRFHNIILPAGVFLVLKIAIKMKKQPRIFRWNMELTLLLVLEPY